MLKRFSGGVALLTMLVTLQVVYGGDEKPKNSTKKTPKEISFKNDVFPVIKKHCLPCHAEENFNPSELSLDSYEQLMAGGEHGVPVVPGKSQESLIIKKLGEEPPFGDRMPLHTKQQIKAGKVKWLTEEEVKIIAGWIDRGAKNN